MAEKKDKEPRITSFQALSLVTPYIFRISIPRASGTGFQIFYHPDKKLCGLATAYHVVGAADEWEEPIRVTHFASKKSIVLKEPDRAVFTYPDKDLAFILFPPLDRFPIDTTAPEIIAPEKSLKSGVEVGWCGFPAVAPEGELCFFAGYISCHLSDRDSYLVDGVAINGVSGGPAFYISADTNKPRICGVISAYRPNLATGELLPGVSIVASVEPYQEDLKQLRSLGDAEKKAEVEKEKQADGAGAHAPAVEGPVEA